MIEFPYAEQRRLAITTMTPPPGLPDRADPLLALFFGEEAGAGTGAEARPSVEGLTSEGSARVAEADVGAEAGAVVDVEAGAEVDAICTLPS